MLTAERLEEIKEYANNNRQHVILNDTHILIDNLAEHTLDLADEVERLREALSYYANVDNYVLKDDLCQHEMDLDGGHKARKALAGEST